MMRKFFASLVILATLFSLDASAQRFGRNDGFRHRDRGMMLHEIGIGYGVASVWGTAQQTSRYFQTFATKNGYSTHDFISFGNVNAEYFYNVGPVQVGACLAYSAGDAEQQQKVGDTYIYKGNADYNAFGLMLELKFYWMMESRFRFYSKGAFGGNFVRIKDNAGATVAGTTAFQVSVAGAEIGNLVKAYAELGFGHQGMIQVGMRFSL